MLKNKTPSSSQSFGKNKEEWEISMVEILELNPWQFFIKSAIDYGRVRH